MNGHLMFAKEKVTFILNFFPTYISHSEQLISMENHALTDLMPICMFIYSQILIFRTSVRIQSVIPMFKALLWPLHKGREGGMKESSFLWPLPSSHSCMWGLHVACGSMSLHTPHSLLEYFLSSISLSIRCMSCFCSKPLLKLFFPRETCPYLLPLKHRTDHFLLCAPLHIVLCSLFYLLHFKFSAWLSVSFTRDYHILVLSIVPSQDFEI